MTSHVPFSLFHTGRAACPDCGAPLALDGESPLAQCEHCGGRALVERRLRTIEPVVAGGIETADGPTAGARSRRPSHQIDAIAQDESHCPACGAMLEAAAPQAIHRCGHCGVESKIERRLVRHTDGDEALAAMERAEPDPAVEPLIRRIAEGTDLADQVRAAHELGEYWGHVNATTARLLPRILEILPRCDGRLEIPLAQIVGKLLCEGDVRLAHGVLRAADRFTFDVNGSRALLTELGLGKGICLKLLLDTADYAASRGATEYACTALWAANTILERNYDRRIMLAEIVLYRLLYLRGPVQAWALELVAGQMGLGVRFPTPVLLRFMDDCALERPELLPYLQKCFYGPGAATAEEYFARIDFIDQLLTPPAKIAALGQLFAPPIDASEEAVARAIERLLAWSADPQLGPAAIDAVNKIIEEGMEVHPGVHAVIRKHGDGLPEDIRRAYLRRVDKSPFLTPLPVKYWSRPAEPPATAFDQQLAEWRMMWRENLIRAVDTHRERQRVAAEYWRGVGMGGGAMG